jgi:hypothetical protein
MDRLDALIDRHDDVRMPFGSGMFSQMQFLS